MNIGKPAGVLQRSQCGLRNQQLGSERFALSLLVSREGRRALALQESDCATSVMPGEHLFLDLRLKQEGGASWYAKAYVDLVLLYEPGFDRIVEFGLTPTIATFAESHRELDTDRPV